MEDGHPILKESHIGMVYTFWKIYPPWNLTARLHLQREPQSREMGQPSIGLEPTPRQSSNWNQKDSRVEKKPGKSEPKSFAIKGVQVKIILNWFNFLVYQSPSFLDNGCWIHEFL